MIGGNVMKIVGRIGWVILSGLLILVVFCGLSAGGGNTIQPGVFPSGIISQASLPDNSVLPEKLKSSEGTPDNSTYYRGDGAWGTPSGSGGGGSTTTLPWDNITSRPTINGITVTGTVLDNASNYPQFGATKVGSGAVDNTEFGHLDNVSSNIQNQLNAKQAQSDALDDLSDRSLSGWLTFADDVSLKFGTDNDFTLRYKSSDGTLVIALDNGAAICTFSKVGNLTCTGEITAPQISTTCNPSDNNCGINVTNVGDPTGANLTAGRFWFDNTLNRPKQRNSDNTATFKVATDNQTTLPSGTNPTVSAPGDILVDTTANQLVYYGTTQQVLSPIFSHTIDDWGPAAGDNVIILYTDRAITITKMVAVIAKSGITSYTWHVYHDTSRAGATNKVVTAGNTTTSTTSGSVITSFDDATIPANSFVYLYVDSVIGSNGAIELTVFYTVDRQ